MLATGAGGYDSSLDWVSEANDDRLFNNPYEALGETSCFQPEREDRNVYQR